MICDRQRPTVNDRNILGDLKQGQRAGQTKVVEPRGLEQDTVTGLLLSPLPPQQRPQNAASLQCEKLFDHFLDVNTSKLTAAARRGPRTATVNVSEYVSAKVKDLVLKFTH